MKTTENDKLSDNSGGVKYVSRMCSSALSEVQVERRTCCLRFNT